MFMTLSGNSSRERLARGRFFKGLEDSRNFSEYIYFFKYWKEECETYTKRKTSNHKLNR